MTPDAAGHIWSWSLSGLLAIALFSVANATPINRQVGISENVFITVQNDTYGIEQRVCSIDSMTYGDGETIPTSSPCEHCICRPPGFACTIISCEYRPGCKAFKRSNQCCPEYQCECEKDGKIYQNGEKIQDSNNPCEICYCQGGEIVCAVLDCYWRSDCQPRYIESRCCPLYDHCPPPTNVGPFMRPTQSTTVAPSFPWFNLSSAVYEVPHRTTAQPTAATFATSLAPVPTPVPMFVTSRSTEESPSSMSTSTSTTTSPPPPPPQPELVVPIKVNIMATSQEQGEDGEIASAPQAVVLAHHSSTSSPVSDTKETEQSDNDVPISPPLDPSSINTAAVLEDSSSSSSTLGSDLEIVPSTPILPKPVESTTIFFAPAIAISILPSPVEQILVTQEASLSEPELANQVVSSEQTDISTTEGVEISPVVVSPGESPIQHEETVTSTPTTTTSVPPALVEVEIDVPTTQSSILSVDEPAVQIAEDEPEVVLTPTSTPDPPTVAPIAAEKVEITTVGGITDPEESNPQEQVETDSIIADAPAPVSEDYPTTIATPMEKEVVDVVVQSGIPSIVLTPPDRESVVDVEVVTQTPSPGIPTPSVEIQPPTLEFDSGPHPAMVSDHPSGEKLVTWSSVQPAVEEKDEIVATTPSPDFHRDPVEDGVDVIPVGQDVAEAAVTLRPTNTETPVITQQGNLEIVEAEMPTFQDFAQNTETEIVTEVSPQEFTTEQPQLSPVLATSPSNEVYGHPTFVNDDPQTVQQVTAEEDISVATVNPNQDQDLEEPIVATTTVASVPAEKEFMHFDDAIHINAATEEEMASNGNMDPEQDKVVHDTPAQPETESIPEVAVNEKETVPQVHPSTNEINSVNVDTFEIIPPQNDAENDIEIQSQVKDGHQPVVPVPMEKVTDSPPGIASNEVDVQSDRNSDDDTIEIFAANYNANADSDSNVTANATTTPLPVKTEQATEPEMALQDDSITVVAATPDHHDVEAESDDDHEEVMHPDDQHGSSDQITTEYPIEEAQSSAQKAAEEDETVPLNDDHVSEQSFTTGLPFEHMSDETGSHDDQDYIQHTTVSSSVNDGPMQDDDDQIATQGRTTPITSNVEEEPQNDAAGSDPTGTTFSPIVAVEKAEKVAHSVVSNEETEPKFRLDLSAFDHSGEIGSPEVAVVGQTTSTPNEVVFDEGAQLATNPPVSHLGSEVDIVIRDDPEVTTSTSIADGQKLGRDGVDITTTQKYGLVETNKDEVEPIQNFQFDEVSPPATTNNPARSELNDDSVPSATTILPSHQLRNSEIEETTISNPAIKSTEDEGSPVVETVNDFVEVSTNFPSGFGVEYREELQDQPRTTLSPSSLFKSDADSQAETTLGTPIFVEDEVKADDGIEVTTFSTIHNDQGKSGLNNGDTQTTVEPHHNDDEVANDEESGLTTTLIPNLSNATSTSAPRIISIDTMMIPEKGVSIPSVSDDIIRAKNDLGRSEISPREGENDSWFIQTAIKNRQMQGLFPSSRSQKRLFRSRTPRDISNLKSSSSYIGSEGDPSNKTKFKNTKKINLLNYPKEIYFPTIGLSL